MTVVRTGRPVMGEIPIFVYELAGPAIEGGTTIASASGIDYASGMDSALGMETPTRSPACAPCTITAVSLEAK